MATNTIQEMTPEQAYLAAAEAANSLVYLFKEEEKDYEAIGNHFAEISRAFRVLAGEPESVLDPTMMSPVE